MTTNQATTKRDEGRHTLPSSIKSETEYELVDLSAFAREDDDRLAHWRGFSKFRQPDGTIWAICEVSEEGGKPMGWALGPCGNGPDCDDHISRFMSRK